MMRRRDTIDEMIALLESSEIQLTVIFTNEILNPRI